MNQLMNQLISQSIYVSDIFQNCSGIKQHTYHERLSYRNVMRKPGLG